MPSVTGAIAEEAIELGGFSRGIGRLAGLTDDVAILGQRIAQGKRQRERRRSKTAATFGLMGHRAAAGVGKDAKQLRKAVAALRGGKYASIPGLSLIDDALSVAMRPKAPKPVRPRQPKMAASSEELRVASQASFARAKDLARPFTEPVGKAIDWVRRNPKKSIFGAGVGLAGAVGLRYLDARQNQGLREADQGPESASS